MARITSSMRKSVRLEAERFLDEYGFSTPPLPPDEAIAARKLEVKPWSLDDLLVKTNLSPSEKHKVQAMLDVNERAITFRDGLPSQKQNWGKLHEVGHEYMKWHRELLYYCPLVWLPPRVQVELEAEADIFAAEAFFFGSQFEKQASGGEFSLNTAKTLADSMFGTSYHATFAHYAEESNVPCCLIVWKYPIVNDDECQPERLVLHYYVPSKSFRGHLKTGISTDDKDLLELYSNPQVDPIKHNVRVNLGHEESYIADAESFSNSYNVFTLLSQPKS